MKRLMTTVAVLALLTTGAHAGSLVCNNPILLITHDTVDTNPVMNSEVDYNNTTHTWRVLHHLADGQVVSRGAQYSMIDYAGQGWAGTYAKNHSLMMKGEISVNTKTGEATYDEWIWDQTHNRVEMHSRAQCQVNLGRLTLDTVPPQEQLEAYQVPNDISGGRLNIRNGPGVNYALVGAIPPGSILKGKAPIECRAREDGVRGADWCHIRWDGVTGWVSRAGMMPLN